MHRELKTLSRADHCLSAWVAMHQLLGPHNRVARRLSTTRFHPLTAVASLSIMRVAHFVSFHMKQNVLCKSAQPDSRSKNLDNFGEGYAILGVVRDLPISCLMETMPDRRADLLKN